MKKPLLIGITGGTGSGKTTVAKALHEAFKNNSVTMIMQDYYYKDQGHLSFEERLSTNYDHPNAFDTELMIEHLKSLLKGDSIRVPIYDFTMYTRKKETVLIEPADIIILEGILLLENEKIRELLDMKIYVDTDADIRILRRLMRDMKERGRSVDSVVNQYLDVVRPMHLKFIEPSKKYADIIIPEGGKNKVAIDIIIGSIKQYLRND